MYNYSTPDEYAYGQYMEGQAAAEAEAQYEEFLQQLLDTKQFYLWALHVAQDELQRKRFDDYKANPVGYFEVLKKEYYDRLNKPKTPVQSSNNVDEDLPF
ncbi:hypothetical protein [Adhaeribacter aquaticus]|uniref:hypothetical protein n=1 Tax=Adhaeribacter aquaticus TaxID=299567 RepID=UPI0003FB18BE|nr:hypothetical protein [Adhaeribacter aquaticus]